MGDCQGSLKAGDYEALKGKIKCTPDILLIPVGWTRDIAGGAAEFTRLLNPVTVIPIHFWTAEEREKFLEYLGNKFAVVKTERIVKAEWDLMPHNKAKKAVVLTPGAYKREN